MFSGLKTLVSSLGKALKGPGNNRKSAGNHYRNRAFLELEGLGDRIAPAAYTVNTLLDTPDWNLNDGVAQDSLGRTSLRAAIMQGNAQAQANVTITFQNGLSGTISLGLVLPDLSKNYSILGPGASVLTVERPSTMQAFRIFKTPGGTSSSIQGLTITGGSAAQGGGISNGGALTVIGCSITNCTAGRGGGIENLGTLTLSNSWVYLNTATLNGVGGGGIYNDGSGIAGTVLNINGGSQIFSNTAYDGGGIYNGYATVQITENSQIYQNIASHYGGGIYCWGTTTSPGTITMNGGQLVDNSAGDRGGGIYLASRSNVTFTDVRIERNSATNHGGGFAMWSNTTLTLNNCTLIDNTAPVGRGGARHNNSTYNPNGGTLTDPVEIVWF